MTSLGARMIASLKEAAAGDLSRVSIDGQIWVKMPVGHVLVPKELTDEMINRAMGRDPEAKSTPGFRLFRNFWNSLIYEFTKKGA